jgi:chromosome partitioning protein
VSDSAAAETLTEPLLLTQRQPRVLAIANQKGGVGKTTTSINLATAIAATGLRVLLIDLDPQANATTGLGLNPNLDRATSYDLLLGEIALADAIEPTLIPNLQLLPSSMNLAGAEIELVALPRREFRLADALAEKLHAFDLVLIDCPPSLGLLTLNALAAADAVLVPLQCEYYALEGVSHLVRTIERVRAGLNPRLQIQGVVLTMFDRRNALSGLVAEDARRHFGAQVYATMIPRNVRLSEAPSHGKPILVYDFHCAGSQAYVHLAAEVLRRERELIAAAAPLSAAPQPAASETGDP